ncbi:MAG: hypothetical protein QOK25_1850 [Thermoleophilaceae bacterium]|nr:hypothetical protein [Thermoleophilaceae bacterium]
MLAPARPLSGAHDRVTDLRGARQPLAPSPVLADPTGRRARRLLVAGRVLASALLVWLCGLVLAGLGLLPLDGVPFGRVLQPAAEPTQLGVRPAPRPPSRSDLRPARSLASTPSTAGLGGPRPIAARGTTVPGRGRAQHAQRTRGGRANHGPAAGTGVATRSTAPSTSTSASPGASTASPHGHLGSGRGQGSTRSGAGAPPSGTTTAPGSSGSAPGHDPNRIKGHGPKTPG